jgi:hypothetical protein
LFLGLENIPIVMLEFCTAPSFWNWDSLVRQNCGCLKSKAKSKRNMKQI